MNILQMIYRQEETPSWKWNEAAGRYQDIKTGQFMARSKILGFVSSSIDASSIAVDQLSELFSNGQLSSTDWRSLMRQEIKEEYIRQYLMGKGGASQMTQADWGSIGGRLANQYRYLENFYNELQDLSPAQIAARSKMYISSARQAFEKARETVISNLGYDQEQWILDGGEHCGDCVSFSGMGWQPLGTFPIPGDGSTQCLSNCLCHKEYKRSEDGTVY